MMFVIIFSLVEHLVQRIMNIMTAVSHGLDQERLILNQYINQKET